MFKREGKNGFYFESFCFEFGFLCGGWCHARASLVAQTVKNPPAMQETWVRSLGWEDLLEKGTAAHSSILAWRIPWTEEPAGYSPWGRRELDMAERLTLPFSGAVTRGLDGWGWEADSGD